MKTKTKNYILSVAAGLLAVAQASAVPIFLGSINDGVAPSVANEVAWVNHLLAQALNSTDVGVTPGSETIKRSGAADPGTGSVVTPPAGNIKTASDPSTVAAGFEYLIAHWGGQGQMSAVWYLGGEAFDVPDNQTDMATLFPGFGFSKGGYSGYTVYGGSRNVPDGGATVTLLGGVLAALGGLGLVRRQK